MSVPKDTIPIAQVEALVRLLYPDDMTPHAKRCFDNAIEAAKTTSFTDGTARTDELLARPAIRSGIDDPPLTGKYITRAAVNDEASCYLTPKGVRMWWNHEAWQLRGLTPNQAWEAGRKQEVYDYAVGGRDMGGT